MEVAVTILGLLAAAATAGANLPQILKCYRTKRAGELSTKTLGILAAGFTGWLAYGVFRNDVIIILANIVSFAQVGTLLLMKRWYSEPVSDA